MSLEIFLKLDGVVGGTRNYQHKGWADLRVTDIRTDGGAEDNAFTETVSLQFAKIRYETFNHAAGDPNAPTASADPKEKFEFRWDMEHNRQWPSA